ncbi:MAG: FtsX-like permease family protein [Candidatus Berkelbacteria bacterium]
MRFFDYIRLALKNLTRQKMRTTLTIIAITVGSLSLILMASLMISIRQSLMDQFRNLGAFNLVTVVKDPNSVDNNNLMGTGGRSSEGKMISDATLAAVKHIDHVVAATPILGISADTMKLAGQDKKTWASVVAFEPDTSVFEIPIVAGRNVTNADLDKIVVGSRFLDDFKYRGREKELIGQKVVFNLKNGGGGGSGVDWGTPPAQPPANADDSWYKEQGNKGIEIEAEIVGVADNGTVGDGQNYINIAWARRLNTQVVWEWDKEAQQKADQEKQAAQQALNNSGQKSNVSNSGNQGSNVSYMRLVKHDNFADQGYTSVVLKVDDTSNIKSVATEVTKLSYGAITAEAMLNQINQIMTMVGIVLAAIGGISLFVAAIGIINTMVMATFERIREIGVMRACGATRATIRRLFTFEAALLGFWGGIFGLIISFLIIRIAKILVAKYATNTNIPIENIGGFPWWLVAGVIVFTTLIGLLSGMGPAIKAAKLNPVDALRYE